MLSKKIVIKINGMSCNHCAKKVQEGLECIDNVKSVKVNLDTKSATIIYKKNIDIDLVKKVIIELGYEFVGKEA